MNSKLCILVLALAAGCHTEHTSEPAGTSLAKVQHLSPIRAWNVNEAKQLIGFVVLFADPERANDPTTQVYSVRNPFHQELGSLDGFGRAYRQVPHQREATLIGTGTVLEGARKILGAGPGSELVEISLDTLRAVPASAKKNG